ncbi:hypothetical protein HYG81_15035 [Natrinema zhouii]|uniref:Uncharacterized protein n=1 Tax=Natrinema zhouii TaxID=1710539 RepID=A0A7D6H529_9EURY|nr:hypothetical protein [Natrinema zhouii]QLK25388.1 hypothetical protein HYG81_15035 [Natrinema zhouii]
MAFTDRIPLMESGATGRNIVVAILYFVLLPFVVIALPFYLLFAIGTNRNGLGDTVANSPLGALPGVGGGGWSAGIVVFAIVIIALGVVGAAVPDTEDPGDAGAEPEVDGTDEDPAAGDGGGGDGGDGSNSGDGSGTANDGSGDNDPDDGGGETDGSSGGTDDSSDGGDNTDGTSDGGDTSEPDNSEPAEFQSIREVDDRYDYETEMLEGSGQTVTDEFSVAGGPTVFIFEHNGESNFIVELINAETGEVETIPVNEIGTTDGAVAVPLGPGDYYFDVDADGSWSVEVAEPLAPPEAVVDTPAEVSGEGMDVVGPIETDGRVTVSGEHNGEENFIVHLIDETAMDRYGQTLVFNEIGEFQGETSVRNDGGAWVAVDADGEWTLEFE